MRPLHRISSNCFSVAPATSNSNDELHKNSCHLVRRSAVSFTITMSAVDLYYGRGLPEPIDVVIQRDKNAKRRAAKELR